jgi:hypothetical protein
MLIPGRYRTITPKARLVPLPGAFLDYLREDGIILPPDDTDNAQWSDNDSGIFSGADNDANDDEGPDYDPSANWPDTHEAIEAVIAELGGKVVPKLNWSAPKDATWMSATNSMECQTANEIYLLLKSSDFVTHDLEHAFDDTDDQEETADMKTEVPYHLVLRKWITLNPALEFRCFVRNRKLMAICQRDLNHFEFLFKMQDKLGSVIQEFFDIRLRDTFPDPNFTFDVYIPPPHDRVWLIDFNPWALRTDPLLFSWLEILTMPEPAEVPEIRVEIEPKVACTAIDEEEEDLESEDDEDDVEELWKPEFRLIRSDDPEAYGFSTPQYSAHKLPRDVVDATSGGGNMAEFAIQWKKAQQLAEQQAQDSEDDDE